MVAPQPAGDRSAVARAMALRREAPLGRLAPSGLSLRGPERPHTGFCCIFPIPTMLAPVPAPVAFATSLCYTDFNTEYRREVVV